MILRGRWPAVSTCCLAAAVSCAGAAWDRDALGPQPKRVLLLIVAAVVCAAAVARRSPRSMATSSVPIHVVVGGATAWLVGLSYLWGSPGGLRDLATLVAALALTTGAVGWLGPPRARRVLESSATALGTIAAGVVLFSFLGGSRGLHLEGGQGNANALGTLLAATLPIGLARGLQWWRRDLGVGRGGFVLRSVSLVLQALALGLSHARVGWVAALAASVLVTLTSLSEAPWRGTRSRGRRQLLVAHVGTLVVVVGAVAAGARSHRWIPSHANRAAVHEDSEVERARRTSRPAPSSADGTFESPPLLAIRGRLWIARHAWRVIEDGMPFGVGVGRFESRYLDAQGSTLSATSPSEAARLFVHAEHAHNEYLQVSAEAGPLAGVGLLATVVLTSAAAFFGGAPGLGGAAVAVGISMLGECSLRIPAVAVLFALVVATAPRASLGTGRNARAGRPRWSLTLDGRLARGASLLGLIACGVTLPAAATDWMATRLLTAAEESWPGQRERALVRAARLAPHDDEAWLRLGLERLESSDVAEARVALERARSLSDSVATEVALGVALAQARDLTSAEGAFRRALSYSPGSFRARIDLGEVLRAQGRLDEADEALTIARSLRSSDPAVIRLEERIGHDRIAVETE